MDDLGSRLAHGDPVAFAELYDRNAARLYRYLAVRLGSRADAEDVLHDIFVRLARTRKRLTQVTNLVAYLFAAARNEAARFVARRTRGAVAETAGAARLELREVPAGELEGREAVEWVGAALARLEPCLRDIVELKTYGGLTFHEISEVTGLPQGTVATRYRKALEKMRIELARHGP
jgi:RNA polymerase sigma-70 factor (ECF subfamily)